MSSLYKGLYGEITLRPSSADRWSRCLASAFFPYVSNVREKSTDAAAAGTELHELADIFLKRVFGADGRASKETVIEALNSDILGTFKSILKGKARQTKHTKERLVMIKDYVTFVLNKYLEVDADFLMTETKIDLPLNNFCIVTGTMDCVLGYGDTLEVIDLKTGQWKVSATSEQLKLYALGAFNKFDEGGTKKFGEECKRINTVKVTIFQPSNSLDNQVEYSLEDLESIYDWYRFYLATYFNSEKGSEPPPAEPGSHCMWCPARFVCKKHLKHKLDYARNAIEDIPENEYGFVQSDSLSDFIEPQKPIESWYRDAKTFVQTALTSGVDIEGYALEDTTHRRVYSDSDAAAELLTEVCRGDSELFDEFFPRTMLSAPKALALWDNKGLSEDSDTLLSEYVTTETYKKVVTRND